MSEAANGADGTKSDVREAAEAKAELRAERRLARQQALASLREKALITLTGFLLTGVLGTMVTTWIQQRGWAWQNRVGKIEKDVQNAMTTYRSAAELVNARWLAAYQMTRALEREPLEAGAPSSVWKQAQDAFAAADRDWTLRFTNVAREVEFYVETPFGVDPAASLQNVYALTCVADPYRDAAGPKLDARSARIALEVINHCQARVKDTLQSLVDEREAGRALDGVARTSAVNLAFRQLDNIYRVNEMLRCQIFARAIAIRSQLATESYWGTFFGVESPAYDAAAGGRSCVEGG
ncbi:MAG: hypothetical protein IPL88_08190 [Rhizobiales bacterium]|nr:hypothetical protein [Hyphomicrobiales bacterium]